MSDTLHQHDEVATPPRRMWSALKIILVALLMLFLLSVFGVLVRPLFTDDGGGHGHGTSDTERVSIGLLR